MLVRCMLCTHHWHACVNQLQYAPACLTDQQYYTRIMLQLQTQEWHWQPQRDIHGRILSVCVCCHAASPRRVSAFMSYASADSPAAAYADRKTAWQ